MSNSDKHAWDVLLWHAGILFGLDPVPKPSVMTLGEAIWRFGRGEDVKIKASLDHFMNEIQKANLYINGTIPSEVITSEKKPTIHRDLVYAISLITTQCMRSLSEALEGGTDSSATTKKTLLSLVWMVSVAWDALLAGDIDNIMEAVDLDARLCSIATIKESP